MIAAWPRTKGPAPADRPGSTGAGGTGVVYAYAILPVDHAGGIHDIDGLTTGMPVRTVTVDDLAVAVSDVDADVFGPDALQQHLQDAEWAQARVLDHHRVLAALPADGLLPFKFCTLFTSVEAVAEAVQHRRDRILEAAARVADAREWGVKLYADGDALVRHTRSASAELRGIARRLAGASKGTAFFLRRKLQEMTVAAAEARAREGARHSHTVLEAAAREASVQPVQPRQVHGRGQEMLLNAAYLVPVDTADGFDARLAALQREYGPRGFTYELTGPWPPYTFASLGPDDDRP